MDKYLKYSLLAVAVLLVGLTGYYFVKKSNHQTAHLHEAEIYTCPMHPQIIRNKPGNCPICGMVLVKKASEKAIESHSIEQLLQSTDYFVVGNFRTTTPKDTAMSSEMNVPGIIAYDPGSSVNITARISGRIEKMYVNYKFQKVVKGQKLFDLYSPELLTEQQNFIYLIANDAENRAIIKALKQKLMLYGMSSNQISALVTSKRVYPVISIYSPASGIVEGTQSMAASGGGNMQKTTETTAPLTLKEGDYITKNEVIFQLVNTDKVWGVFNVIQGYTSFIKVNQPIRITSELDETAIVNAKVNFIATQLNPSEKTNQIRVYLNNDKQQFPIGLRLQGTIQTNPIKGIWIPRQALVSLGNKKIVFIKKQKGFQTAEIKTAAEMNDYVQVIDGVTAKDILVENAQYLIDSESFIKTE